MIQTIERYLTPKQVAEQLQVHPVTVRVWLGKGRIRGTQLGAKNSGWRVPESEVQRILEHGIGPDVTADN